MPSSDLLDLPTLQGLVDLDDGGTGLIQEMIGLLREDAPAHVREVRAGLEAGDADRVARAAHALKGGAAAIGASRLRVLAAEVEAMGRGGVLNPDLPAAAELEPALQASLAALEAFAQQGA